MPYRHTPNVTLLAAALFGMSLQPSAQAQTAKIFPSTMETGAMAQDEAAVRHTLASYNAALNTGDTSAVLPLYE